MARVQVYLPDELHAEMKARELPASALLQDAVRREIARLVALEETERYLAELAGEVGEPSARQVAAARAMARRIARHQLDETA